MTTTSLLTRRDRGSVLLVSLVFAAVIALSLGSFIKLATQSTQLSYRSFYAGAAMNAAETGLEQAMWALNQHQAGVSGVWSANGWSTFSGGGTAVRQTINLGQISGGATAVAKVYVSDSTLSGNNPFIISRSIITPGNGVPIERWIQITLKQRREVSGFIAGTIDVSGKNLTADSYDSRLGAYTPEPSFVNRSDKGFMGTTAMINNALTIGGSTIHGSASIATASVNDISKTNSGTIGPFGTPAGTLAPGHVLTNFTANFEDKPHPAAYTGLGAYNIGTIGGITLPRLLDLPAPDGKYYYNANTITVGGNNDLIISNNVVIRLSATSGDSIKISGNATIRINAPSLLAKPRLEIFTQADAAINGNGIANNSNPEAFRLWGTRPQSADSPQQFDLNGNAGLSAVVYAPKADIKVNGGGNAGNIFGSIVANKITLNGNARMHYDLALDELKGNEPLQMDEWNEFVTYADRNTYASLMNF